MQRRLSLSVFVGAAAVAAALPCLGHGPAAGPPAYEHAYANGRTVTISVKDPHPGRVVRKSRGLYYEWIYPIGWEFMTDSIPQCNPCDHAGDGEDYFDYHDHVFSGTPGNLAAGTYRPLWQLSFVVPAYTGDPDHDL